MKEAEFPFDEPWPDDETKSVVDAVRSAVAASRQHRWGDSRSADRASSGSAGGAGVIESALGEAGRRWALAHQSASLMRTRLDALEASMDTELDAGTDEERSAALRAWRTVTDAATWTSLNQLEQAALVDPLTGVGNRRALDLMLTRAISGARRSGSRLVVVAVDLDGLKRINDSQGHAEGDRTLTSLVGAVGNRLRASDAVFRTGGDEFAVVLPGTGLRDVDALMRRVSSGDTPKFTWGAAELTAEHQRPSELLDAADTDLYRHRGVERAMAAAGAGLVVADLSRSRGSLRLRVSRRVSVAAAAGLVAISGTLATVATLSPGTQTALPPKHGVRPPAPTDRSVRSGGPTATPPTTIPSPSPSSPVAAVAAPTPATSRGASPAPAATEVTPPSAQLASSIATTAPNPAANPTGSLTASNPSTAPATVSTPATTAPVASTPTPAPTTVVAVTLGKSTNSLPAQAAAAQAAQKPKSATLPAQAAAAQAAVQVAASVSAQVADVQATASAEVEASGAQTAAVQSAAVQAAAAAVQSAAVQAAAAAADAVQAADSPTPTAATQSGGGGGGLLGAERHSAEPASQAGGQHSAARPSAPAHSSSRRR